MTHASERYVERETCVNAKAVTEAWDHLMRQEPSPWSTRDVEQMMKRLNLLVILNGDIPSEIGMRSVVDGPIEGFTPYWVKPLNGSLSKNLALT